jgi:hypothetical protein
MIRNCNGGNGRSASWCGKPATVVVSAKVHSYGDRPFQWYACNDPEHHKYDRAGEAIETTTESLAAWLARNALSE